MTLPRLTPHQGKVLDRIGRLGGASRGRTDWVEGASIGSPAGCGHLVDKGYAERIDEAGPRGGIHPRYRLNLAGLGEWTRRRFR